MKKGKIPKINFLAERTYFAPLYFIAFVLLGFSLNYFNSCLPKSQKLNTIQTVLKKDIVISNDEKVTNTTFSDSGYPVSGFTSENSNQSLNYFSDLFSSSVYINSTVTDFFLDENITAYTFKPVFNISEIVTAQANEKILNLAKKRQQEEMNNNYCLGNRCLALKNESLFLNQKLVNFPPELESLKKENKIVSLSLGILENKWMLGAVIGGASDEYGLVYYFDGDKFNSLISLNSEVKIKPRYGRRGGTINFGGYDSDFLIIYGGYNGVAYRVRGSENKENFTDLSSFFGLRVTDGGMKTQISVSGKGINSSWLVCGWNGKSFRAVKLWQNNTEEIVGAIDLGNIIFNSEQTDSSSAQIKKEVNNNQLVSFSEPGKENSFIFTFFPKINEANVSSIWRLSDKGFDNGHNYLIVSSDLNTMGKPVVSATINNINFNGLYDLFLSNNQKDWSKVEIGKIINFPDKIASSLYWKISAHQNKNIYYSPFFDGIGSIEYGLQN